MSWFKVDDGFYSHPKVVKIPRSLRAAAIGTWTLAGTWSADKLRDGYVPAHMIEEVGGSIEGADALVDVKLWRRRKDGYQFVNWEEYQPTRAQVEETRAKETKRKAEQRARIAVNPGARPEDVPPGHDRNPDTPSRPVPSRTRPLDQDLKRSSSLRDSGTDDVHNPVQSVDNYASALQAFADEFQVDLLLAGVAVDWMLARAKDTVRMPRRYVRRIINQDRPVWERFILTDQLPV